ncbi:unnamed protein product [Gongylonema pulchrum]|uniref:Uncharacterized protein n=1 Tax=Gongylonema pulchrum TaxID=637853 RepID=A0A183EXN5_9BILA|nr:unnamed protein product [Gongylonema pulchrum]
MYKGGAFALNASKKAEKQHESEKDNGDENLSIPEEEGEFDTWKPSPVYRTKKKKTRKKKIGSKKAAVPVKKLEAVEFAEGEFETYVPNENNEFDNYTPSPPIVRTKKKKTRKKKIGSKKAAVPVKKLEAVEFAEGEFETYVPNENNEFDNYTPSPPIAR